ncbi:hypothetical protein NQZ68_034758 [Dissostichus eleginoides]|nr:hypothetical protein NQZ68_034758 [Dissostichus eleginoides]
MVEEEEEDSVDIRLSRELPFRRSDWGWTVEKQKRQQLIISIVPPLSSLFVTETNTAISASEHLNVIEWPTER